MNHLDANDSFKLIIQIACNEPEKINLDLIFKTIQHLKQNSKFEPYSFKFWITFQNSNLNMVDVNQNFKFNRYQPNLLFSS